MGNVLTELRINDLGVIDQAVLEFGPGLTVLSGETGVGKTMVLTSLALLFGGRADAAVVRAGSRRAVVEGRVSVRPDHPAALRATAAGADLDDGDLLLARHVSAEGRSRAVVGGRTSPVAVLAELADDLIAMHGQSDQQLLRSPARQRDVLDRSAGAGLAGDLADYRTQLAELRAAEAEHRDLVRAARERVREAELLRLGLAELEAVDPQPGEDGALAAESDRLVHADLLRTAAEVAHVALAGGDTDDGAGGSPALDTLAAARRALEQVADHDPDLAGLAKRVAEAGYLVVDIAGELASYASGIEADPVRLSAVQERRSRLTRLIRAYADDPTEGVDSVLDWGRRSAQRLMDLDGTDDRIAELAERADGLRRQLGVLASRISATRAVAAERLAEAATAELAALAMPHARIEVRVAQRLDPEGLPVPTGTAAVSSGVSPENAPVERPSVGRSGAQPGGRGPTAKRASARGTASRARADRDVHVDETRLLAYGNHGVDDVEILLAPHPGAPPRPVGKGASGGELSRVMLALEVVLAGADPVGTFVFDEVDAGVGGRAAIEVGRRLARLAADRQVVVVTHLPQVAAFGDSHLVVEKRVDGEVTRSSVRTLDAEGRITEVSRMLAGVDGSAAAVAHAAELLEMGRVERAARGVRAS